MEDINQHFEQLRRLLVKLGYPHSVDKERICAGVTTELLPLLHFGLLSHSKVLATYILESGYDLYKKNDLRFTEGIYKLLRKEFKYNPILQCSQFLTDKGFTKRKIQFVVKCLKLGIAKHNELIKKKKLQTQSKISWNKTNLAKKVEKVIKNNNNNNKKKQIASKQTVKVNKKMVSKPKTIISTHRSVENDDDDDDNDGLMNDSLTVDEIRSDLPQPIMMQNVVKPISSESDNDENEEEEEEEEEESDDENKQNEMEEKAMEISDEQLYEQQQQKIDEVDESMKIPQHTYDMNLIPEYDPTKYVHISPPNKMDTEDVGDRKDIMATEQHYSGSYLDTYSTLMDIPHTLLHHESGHNEQEEEEEEEEEEQDNDNKDDNSEEKRGGMMISQQMEPVIVSNIGRGNIDNDGDKKQMEHDENEEEEEEEEEMDENMNNNNNDGDDDEDDDDDEEEQGENKQYDINNAIKMIMNRLDNMENKMDKEFSTIGARLTILEGKIKFIESQQKNNGNGQLSSTESTSSRNGGGGIKASSGMIYKPSSLVSSSSSSERKESVHSMNGDNDTFIESTIGSSSLPISLTPAPIRNNNSNHRRDILSKTMPRNIIPIQSTINNNNHYISSTRQQPKHIHAPIARSPFIPSQQIGNNIMSLQSFGGTIMSDNNNNKYGIGTGMSLYSGNPHIDIMRYPLSNNSQSNERKSVSTNNGSISVPKIQSVALTTPSSSSDNNNNNNSNDPDNTLNFIKELKEMLKSTDELLKSKPRSLYDSNV